MEDLTTGSINRHLLKTTSFMLVTMVFQTLYFLVDLYWVGPSRQGSHRGCRHRRQADVRRARDHADARRRHDDAHLARRRAQGARARTVGVDQSLLLSAFIGVVFLIVVTALRAAYVNTLSPDPVSGTGGQRVPLLVHSGNGASVPDGRHGRGASGNRQLQAGHDRADRDGASSTWCSHRPSCSAGSPAVQWASPAPGSRRSSPSLSAPSGSRSFSSKRTRT